MYYCKALLSFLLATMTLAVYGRETADTVKVIKRPKSVIVTQSGTTTTIEAVFLSKDSLVQETYLYEVNIKNKTRESTDSFPDNWGMSFPFMHSDSQKGSKDNSLRKSIVGGRHIYWGWRFNYADKGNIKNCYELGVRDLIGVAWSIRGSEFEIGLGFGMKRLLAQDSFMYDGSDGQIHILPVPEGMTQKWSRLDMSCIHVPILFNQKIGSVATFTVGGILNFNVYARGETRLSTGNLKIKNTYKGLHQNFFTPELMAAFHLEGIGLYSSWSPIELFKKPYGPSVKGWSIGIELFF